MSPLGAAPCKRGEGNTNATPGTVSNKRSAVKYFHASEAGIEMPNESVEAVAGRYEAYHVTSRPP